MGGVSSPCLLTLTRVSGWGALPDPYPSLHTRLAWPTALGRTWECASSESRPHASLSALLCFCLPTRRGSPGQAAGPQGGLRWGTATPRSPAWSPWAPSQDDGWLIYASQLWGCLFQSVLVSYGCNNHQQLVTQQFWRLAVQRGYHWADIQGCAGRGSLWALGEGPSRLLQLPASLACGSITHLCPHGPITFPLCVGPVTSLCPSKHPCDAFRAQADNPG